MTAASCARGQLPSKRNRRTTGSLDLPPDRQLACHFRVWPLGAKRLAVLLALTLAVVGCRTGDDPEGASASDCRFVEEPILLGVCERLLLNSDEPQVVSYSARLPPEGFTMWTGPPLDGRWLGFSLSEIRQNTVSREAGGVLGVCVEDNGVLALLRWGDGPQFSAVVTSDPAQLSYLCNPG
jgi:hypothetical protein